MHGQLLGAANMPLKREGIVPAEACGEHVAAGAAPGVPRSSSHIIAAALVDFGPVSPRRFITSRYVKGVIAARLPRTSTAVVEPGLTFN